MDNVSPNGWGGARSGWQIGSRVHCASIQLTPTKVVPQKEHNVRLSRFPCAFRRPSTYMNGVGMIWGHECNYLGDGDWDLWDNVKSRWVSTGALVSGSMDGIM